MIRKEELVKIGQFNKPHGIKGELSFTFTNDVFDESEGKFLICEMDGIFVPFRLEEYRFKSDTVALIRLENISSEELARPFTNLDVYFPKKDMPEIGTSEAVTWDFFIGFILIDQTLGEIGEIVDVDESTINTLFVVRKNDQEHLIPAVEDFILDISAEDKILQVDLPEGLIDLD